MVEMFIVYHACRSTAGQPEVTSPPNPLSGAERGRTVICSPSPRRRGGWGVRYPLLQDRGALGVAALTGRLVAALQPEARQQAAQRDQRGQVEAVVEALDGGEHADLFHQRRKTRCLRR